MSLSAALLPEFDQEMAGVRRVLERVPDDRFEWRPHPRSYSLLELATHLANLPNWGRDILTRESLDVMPEGKPWRNVWRPATRDELLARFDANLADERAALAAATDEQLLAYWTLLANGSVVFSMPRRDVFRRSGMNHVIHHRAQLVVYLRLLDVPVPGLYGPSADEREAG